MTTQRVVALAGEPEYDAHHTMRPVLAQIADELELTVDYRTPSGIADEPEFPVSSFGGLAALDEADLLVVYTRFRRLPDEEMEALDRFLARGGPVVGLRTSSHAFKFADDERWQHWNHWFGAQVLGSPWISHHGHGSRTEVTVLADSPVELVDGVPERFTVRSWLYRTDLAPWCRPILHGTPIDPESPPTPSPVAWYGNSEGRPTFYTSLGHAEDLASEPVWRLLRNGIGWVLRDPAP